MPMTMMDSKEATLKVTGKNRASLKIEAEAYFMDTGGNARAIAHHFFISLDKAGFKAEWWERPTGHGPWSKE
jgi:hypothetical protein